MAQCRTRDSRVTSLKCLATCLTCCWWSCSLFRVLLYIFFFWFPFRPHSKYFFVTFATAIFFITSYLGSCCSKQLFVVVVAFVTYEGTVFYYFIVTVFKDLSFQVNCGVLFRSFADGVFFMLLLNMDTSPNT